MTDITQPMIRRLDRRPTDHPPPWAVTVAGVHPFDARRHHLAAWVPVMTQQPNARTGKPMAPAIVARRLSCLAKFYDYGIEVEALTHSPVLHVRRPKVSEESASVGLSRDELVRLLDEAERHSLRFGALVHLLAFNGLRIAEALAADVDDLTHDRGHRVLRITRKGGKAATVPLAPPTVRTLDAYVGDRRQGPVFLDRNGTTRLADETAYKQLRRLSKAAGIAAADEISPHSLRHTYATEALDAGAALQHVQNAMGHADPRPTRRYDRSRNKLAEDPTYLLETVLRRD